MTTYKHLSQKDRDDNNWSDDEGASPRLNATDNVVFLFRLQTLRQSSATNFVFAILALIYLGLNLVMFAVNYMLVDDCEAASSAPRSGKSATQLSSLGGARSLSSDPSSVFEAQCGSPVSVYTFHLLEFSGTFLFSILQACALLFPPSSMTGARNMYDDKPGRLRLVLFFAVVVSFVPAMLIWLNIEIFEVVAHQIEYSNEVTMSFIDIVLFLSVVRHRERGGRSGESDRSERGGRSGESDRSGRSGRSGGSNGLCMACVALLVALIQLFIYNARGVDEATGERRGEKDAHYCEFAFEIISAAITFYFCISSKVAADHELRRMMFGRHPDCRLDEEGAEGSPSKRNKKMSYRGGGNSQREDEQHSSPSQQRKQKQRWQEPLKRQQQQRQEQQRQRGWQAMKDEVVMGWSPSQRKLKEEQLRRHKLLRKTRFDDRRDDGGPYSDSGLAEVGDAIRSDGGRAIMSDIEGDLEVEMRGVSALSLVPVSNSSSSPNPKTRYSSDAGGSASSTAEKHRNGGRRHGANGSSYSSSSSSSTYR